MQCAVLDDDGLLLGFEVGTGGQGAGRVPVPDDCDLAPGRYRYRGGRFWPVPAARGGTPAGQGEAMRAIALGLAAVRDAGLVRLPDETLQWLDQTPGR